MSRSPPKVDSPKVYTIAPGVSFVDALASGILERWGGDPLALAPITLLLPTRRSCRSLSDAFLRACGGRPLMLPRLLPLGDLDAEELQFFGDDPAETGGVATDLPPATPMLRRQLLLARLILAWGQAGGQESSHPPRADQAAGLARDLAQLLDQVETEGLAFERLAELVPADYAHHWQTTLKFLTIVTDQWPKLQAAEGCIGPAERRRRLLEAQAAAWRRRPTPDPVIVAGSTGSIPATATLIQVVAGLPQGLVILPGLDREADDDVWRALADDPSHPQFGLARLLAGLAVERDRVGDWHHGHAASSPEPRAAFLQAALRPAETTTEWRTLAKGPERDRLVAALDGVDRIDCASSGEETLVIALLLRQALEVAERTAALVTPDRGLARRVAAELQRWGVEIDDSAGVPLAETPPGTFLRLTARMAAEELAPVPLLATLKHPLAAGGLSEGDFRRRVRALELAVLRGPRPGPGFDGLIRALRAAEAEATLIDWVADLAKLAEPLVRALRETDGSLSAIVGTHFAFAERLAATDDDSGDGAPGAVRLWAKDAGEAAAGFAADLLAAAADAPAMDGAAYPALLTSLMAGRVVRPPYGRHPRLSILGPLEARLSHRDVVILGGLNEGTWPAQAEPGPWLSRPMRHDFGLPAPERRIGLAAHDFVQLASAPRVYLTRATRVDGTPTVPSRWLLRMDALLSALGKSGGQSSEAPQWLAWAQALDRPARIAPQDPPAPRPPVAARPRRISVTQVETWMRNPYALYAREILKLRPLEPIDGDPGAAEKGTLIHESLERFVAAHPETLPDDPQGALIAAGEEVFRAVRAKPGLWAFWWPRFLRIAVWFAETERRRRPDSQRAWSEVRGALTLDGPAGPFRLTAKADRIDLLADGRLGIIDYKTGALPSTKAVRLGFAPQLPLEAAIAAATGFPGVPAGQAAWLGYWRLTGGDPAGEIKELSDDPAELADQALEGLRGLIAVYDDPATPYFAVPRPNWAPRFDDYAHLARIKEWSAGVLGEDGS